MKKKIKQMNRKKKENPGPSDVGWVGIGDDVLCCSEGRDAEL